MMLMHDEDVPHKQNQLPSQAAEITVVSAI